jgi:hypothetical protein
MKEHGVVVGCWLSVSYIGCYSYTGLSCFVAGFREANCPCIVLSVRMLELCVRT